MHNSLVESNISSVAGNRGIQTEFLAIQCSSLPSQQDTQLKQCPCLAKKLCYLQHSWFQLASGVASVVWIASLLKAQLWVDKEATACNKD